MTIQEALVFKMFVDAAKKFINKVEIGQARSRETYADLKAALQAAEDLALQEDYTYKEDK